MIPKKNLEVYFKVHDFPSVKPVHALTWNRSDGPIHLCTLLVWCSSSYLFCRFTSDCLQSNTWLWQSTWWLRSWCCGPWASLWQLLWTVSPWTNSGISPLRDLALIQPNSTMACRSPTLFPTLSFSSCPLKLSWDCRYQNRRNCFFLECFWLVACMSFPL